MGTISFGERAAQVLNIEVGTLGVAVRLELLHSPALFLRDRTKFKALQTVVCPVKTGVAVFPVMFTDIKSDTETELLSSKSWNMYFFAVVAPPLLRGAL